MSCRVYAAAAAAAAAYRQRSSVADVGSGMVNYGRSCHEAAAAATTFCATDSSGLGGRHCGGPFYGYPTYGGTYGVDGGGGGGSGRLCSTATAEFDIGDVSDFTSRYLFSAEHRSDMTLCGGGGGGGGSEGFVPPPPPPALTQSSSSSSVALVELNDFVSRGDRLMQTGETPTPAACSRLPAERLQHDGGPWHASTSPTTDTSTTTTTTTTRSSCLYSAVAVAKSACSRERSAGAFTKTNTSLCAGAGSFPSDNRFETSTCDKAKTSLSSGNNRTTHTGL